VQEGKGKGGVESGGNKYEEGRGTGRRKQGTGEKREEGEVERKRATRKGIRAGRRKVRNQAGDRGDGGGRARRGRGVAQWPGRGGEVVSFSL